MKKVKVLALSSLLLFGLTACSSKENNIDVTDKDIENEAIEQVEGKKENNDKKKQQKEENQAKENDSKKQADTSKSDNNKNEEKNTKESKNEVEVEPNVTTQTVESTKKVYTEDKKLKEIKTSIDFTVQRIEAFEPKLFIPSLFDFSLLERVDDFERSNESNDYYEWVLYKIEALNESDVPVFIGENYFSLESDVAISNETFGVEVDNIEVSPSGTTNIYIAFYNKSGESPKIIFNDEETKKVLN